MYKVRLMAVLVGGLLLMGGAYGYASPTRMMVEVAVDGKAEMSSLMNGGFDVIGWGPEDDLLVIVTPEELSRIQTWGLPVRVLIQDLGSHRKALFGDNMIDFGPYYTFTEAEIALDQIHAAFPGIVSERITIGESWELLPVWAVKVSDNVAVEEGEPEVLITGVHHAREPISCTVCIETIRYLAENYGSDPIATFLVDEREIWFVPILNPDGYTYNEIGDGYWRKNKRDNNENGQFDEYYDGVDPNRNYSYMWGYDDEGSSPDPTSAVYRGPYAFSEPENLAIRDFCGQHEFILAANYHSHGNYVIFSWGYDTLYTPEDSTFRLLTRDLVEGNGHRYGTGWELMYLVNGDADDWGYGELIDKPKIYAVTVEVGEAFWQPDTHVIVEQIEENLVLNLRLAQAAGVFLRYSSHELSWAGDTLVMQVDLYNQAVCEEASDVAATLRTRDPYVMLVDATSTYGSLAPLTSASGDQFRFLLDPSCPEKHIITFWLDVTASGGYECSSGKFDVVRNTSDYSFYDDFEDGLGQWVAESPWGITDESSHSETQSATDSPYGQYGHNMDISLTMTNPLDLSACISCTLGYYHAERLVSYWGWSEDYVHTEASLDNGSTWEIVKSASGMQPNWHGAVVSLDDFCGFSEVLVRFRLDTDGNSRDDGFYVDDVIIRAHTNHLPTSPAPLRPAHGESLATQTPTLVVANAFDADGDDLTYGFAVYADGELTQMVACASGVAEGTDSTSWTVPVELPMDAWYWWLAYADDGTERGLNMETGLFGVGNPNAVAEGPDPVREGLSYFLCPNVPNPVVARTRIEYSLASPASVPTRLDLFNVVGQRVATLVDGPQGPGRYAVEWDGCDERGKPVASGVYFYRLQSGTFMTTQKMLVLR
jgi:carboxypeptidase T